MAGVGAVTGGVAVAGAGTRTAAVAGGEAGAGAGAVRGAALLPFGGLAGHVQPIQQGTKTPNKNIKKDSRHAEFQILLQLSI